MADTARVLREALLGAARVRAMAQRILCCLRLDGRPDDLRPLLAAVRSLGDLAVAGFDLHLLTDLDAATERESLQRALRPLVPRGGVAVHAGAGLGPSAGPTALETDIVRAGAGRYDLFLGLPGDLLFGMSNLVYWLAAREALKPFGLIPTFLRYDFEATQHRFHAACPPGGGPEAALACGDWLFVRPGLPCAGIRLRDRDLAAQAPEGGRGAAVIAFQARTLLPAPDCCVRLLPNGRPGSPPDRLPLERVYHRRPAPDPAEGNSPSTRRIERGSLRAQIDDRRPDLAAHGIAAVSTFVPGGSYRRSPPLLIDSSAVSAADRPVCTRGLGRCAEAFEPVLLAVLSDACLVGDGTVVTSDGLLVEESCWEFLAQRRPLPGVTQAPDASLCIPERPHRVIPGPALLLQRHSMRNYGHWLLDVAIPLALAAERGLLEGVQIVTGGGVPPEQPAVTNDTFRLLAPGVPVLDRPDGAMWQVGALHYLFPLGITPFFRLPEGIAALRRRLLAGLPAAPRRRLFVSRADNPRRRLLDEDALFAICAGFGFERVVPEQHSLAEQAAMFHAAEAVVGVKGASLTNVLFCLAGTPLIVLSPGDWWDPLFWDLAAQVGCPYLEVFGPSTDTDMPISQNPFRIEPAGLRRALHAALPAVAAAAADPAPPVPIRRAAPPLPGPEREALRQVHAALAPQRYLQIGAGDGDTLLLSTCATIVVDPDLRLDREAATQIPLLFLFPLTSEAFFLRHDPAALLGGPPDLVLIDGARGPDAVRRDLDHVARCAHPGTVVALLPVPAADTTARLRRDRPDLTIQEVDVPPGGLALIRGLVRS
jgi:capsular polysaccharide biosynthesis protein